MFTQGRGLTVSMPKHSTDTQRFVPGMSSSSCRWLHRRGPAEERAGAAPANRALYGARPGFRITFAFLRRHARELAPRTTPEAGRRCPAAMFANKDTYGAKRFRPTTSALHHKAVPKLPTTTVMPPSDAWIRRAAPYIESENILGKFFRRRCHVSFTSYTGLCRALDGRRLSLALSR